MVVLSAFTCYKAMADTVVYDHFDGATLDLTKWYTPSGFLSPQQPGDSKLYEWSLAATPCAFGSLSTWSVNTQVDFKLAAAPNKPDTAGFCFGLVGGVQSACLRNDQGAYPGWRFVVGNGVDPVYRSAALTAPAAGDLYSVVWNSTSTSLLLNGTSIATTTVVPTVDMAVYSYTQKGILRLTFDYVAVGSTVPEPSTIILLSTALVGLLAYAWRKRR